MCNYFGVFTCRFTPVLSVSTCCIRVNIVDFVEIFDYRKHLEVACQIVVARILFWNLFGPDNLSTQMEADNVPKTV